MNHASRTFTQKAKKFKYVFQTIAHSSSNLKNITIHSKMGIRTAEFARGYWTQGFDAD